MRITHLLRREAVALVVCLLGAATLLAPTTATADDSAPVTWAVRPADASGPDGRSWVELELDPGEAITENLAVQNLSDTTVTFSITSADGYFTDTGRFNMLPSSEESTDAGTWISAADTVTAGPGETVVAPFTVTVPRDATPGDHAAGIAASVKSQGDDGGTAVSVESRVGFRVMVRVAGEIVPSLEVQSSGTYLMAWNPLDPGAVSLTLTLANTGNVRLHASGSAVWNGATLTAAQAEDGRDELLPGDHRVHQIRVPGVWPLLAVSVPLTVDQSLVLPDGTEQELEPVVQTVVVWAMPWPQIIVVAAVALMAWGILWRRRRRAEEIETLIARARDEGRREGGIS